MKQRISHLISSARADAERGAVMFLAAIMILIVMIGGAIAVDLSMVATRGQSLQNAADSAALAGVQAYRQSMGAEIEATAEDEEAARAAVAALLEQNGITDITPVITFPDPENDTEVMVTLLDEDPGLLLSGFTGVDGSVERSATARFERCETGCIQDITIPPPFRAVNAIGQGDGYKPIPVGNHLYALNHNATSLQIVCVDRSEDPSDVNNVETDGLCWDDGAAKNAYPSNFQPPRNPEMPSTGVVGSRIFWSVSVNSGHYLFCFETITATPCSTPYQINTSPRVTSNPTRIQNRGGGTFSPDGERVYVFTDDNRIHCILPQDIQHPTTLQWIFVMDPCTGYELNGLATGIGQLTKDGDVDESTWPDNDASMGNHGSSIDRIYDPVENRVYHTMHIDNAPSAEPPAYCANVDNDSDPRGIVVLKNAQSQLYLAVDDDGNLVDGVDPQDPGSQWQILTGYFNRGRVFVFRSILTGDDLSISSNYPTWGQELELRDRYDIYDSIFQLDDQGSTSRIRTYQTQNNNGSWQYAYVREDADLSDPNNPDIEFIIDEYNEPSDAAADWIVRPAECEVSDEGPPTYEGLVYEQGTFVDCFDLTFHEPCSNISGFQPSKIHNDWDSFSGRLFFYMSADENPIAQGVCSTGFTEHWEWTDMSSYTDLKCVDIEDGSDRDDLEFSMPSFVSALAATNTGEGNPGWGTWGDPHYNAHTNRLFYPTQRAQSRVLCWDFDTQSFCGQRQAFSGLGEIQDYGFFSEGNCVFGLGHRAIFWAFKADDIYEDCSGSSTTAPIRPCDCGGELYWGTLVFDVDLPNFDSFLIQLHDAPDGRGNRIYPPENWSVDPVATAHSLHHHGDTIDLNYLEALTREQRLWVTVTVEADGDPWAEAEQKFTVEFERTPRLTD